MMNSSHWGYDCKFLIDCPMHYGGGDRILKEINLQLRLIHTQLSFYTEFITCSADYRARYQSKRNILRFITDLSDSEWFTGYSIVSVLGNNLVPNS